MSLPMASYSCRRKGAIERLAFIDELRPLASGYFRGSYGAVLYLLMYSPLSICGGCEAYLSVPLLLVLTVTLQSSIVSLIVLGNLPICGKIFLP
jgi:hypothetical protein